MSAKRGRPPKAYGAKHSILGPSSAERWWNCPGSVAATADTPWSPPSRHAAEGTVAHWLCEQHVTGKLPLAALTDMVGTIIKESDFEIEVTDEMVDAVIEYADTIRNDMAEMLLVRKPGKIVSKAEVRVSAPGIHDKLFGTADYVLYQEGYKLRVYDFKYGKGVVVDPKENKQMAIYAVAVMEGTAGQNFEEIELVIVQPRAGGDSVRRWSVPREWLTKFRNELKAAALATEDTEAPIRAGAWCRWCAAKPVCKAVYEDVQKQAMIDFSDPVPELEKGLLPSVNTLPVELLVQALGHEEYINAWFESARLYIKGMLEAGLEVPGMKLVEGRSNRKYIDEEAVVKEFEPLLGREALFESKLLSPSKLEKIVGKGKLDHLTFKPEGSKSIARDTDPRPQAKNSAQLDFDEVKVPEKDPLEELMKDVPSRKIWA